MPEQALQPIADFGRLSRADLFLILKLDEDGRTQTYIAQQVGCSQSTISDVLREYKGTELLAKQKAHNLALKAVRKLEQAMDPAAEAGRSGPQEAILKLAGLLKDDSSKAASVNVVLGIQIQ